MSRSENIIGRKKELEILDQLLKSNSSEFLALYGRRRVGKTFLIREYLKSNIIFSFSGSFEVRMEIQLNNFHEEYIRWTKGQKETLVPKNWNKAFSYLTDYLYSIKDKEQKLVVFIDELPWLDTPRSGFVSALEYFWNQHGSAMPNLLLIACGSAASWMQKKLLKAKGGLYNRVTKRIRLQPFNLYETELFCKKKHLKLSRYQIVQLYMVMGGIPFYLNELTRGKSAIQLINDICFTSTGLLFDEYEQLYYSLFKKADKHISVVETLASHPQGLMRSELIKKTKIPEGGGFSKVIEELYESGFITKYRPFNKKKKDTIYRLIDLYSLFYLKFIKGNLSGQNNSWKKIVDQDSFKIWSGYAYENICMLHINQILLKLGISGIYTELSSWKYRGNDESPGAQVDLLIDRKDGVVNLCEAKFTQKEYIITKEYVARLRKKRTVFEYATKTKKSIVSTLITTYPAIQNKYYLEEVDSEVCMDDLFLEN